MAELLPPCQNLKEQVDYILQIVQQEASLASCDVTQVQTSMRKAISPKFEIVFAGAFSAGKSMLINALLGRELLYSAEGHATGTECKIEYAHPENEKVVLTFLSEAEVREQVFYLCEQLGLHKVENINQEDAIELLTQGSEAIIFAEGGESKSERAKQANALIVLLSGYVANRQHIHTINNATYSMAEFNFNNLKEAAAYARRGSNSAVLKRIEYYCNHPLLQDANVIIDTPGIDAPVEKDAQLTYEKIQHPDVSAVVCVLKAASMGDMTRAETQLLEQQISSALQNAARVECDRFVRESPRFYDEGTFSIYQFRQTLQQTSQTFDCESMVEAEPAIKQLLKLDFEPKVSNTIRITFRQTINQSFKTLLLPMADIKSDAILQQYSKARAYLGKTLAKEAQEKVYENKRLSDAVDEKIASFNQSVSSINGCLAAMQLYDYLLPVIESTEPEILDSASFENIKYAKAVEA
ncbi:MAG: dynamin-like GTPase family protein [Rivularia sp. (in: Bacteria)]|nr:dynamin-like GTPase family protein [Rivularia sp. MS3]